MGRVVLHLPGGGDEKPYVVGTYVGDGEKGKKVSVGFPVQAIFICGENAEYVEKYVFANRGVNTIYCAAANSILKFDWTDIGLSITEEGQYENRMNRKNTLYYYIAFH